MIKDAELKVVQIQALVNQFKKETEESDLSFEEAEVVYYVMYFTSDVEKQLRTMGRVDTGTLGAIGQCPQTVRDKVFSNIAFLEGKIKEMQEQGNNTYDHLYRKYWDTLAPKPNKDDGTICGLNIKDFLQMEPIRILAKALNAPENGNST